MFNAKGEEDFRNGQKCLMTSNGSNIREAMVFFEKAANEGHIEATYQMGYWNFCGEPQIARNCKEALSCFEKCAKAGLSRAKYFVGMFYFWGMAVEKDEKKAFGLLEEAFKEGIYEASGILCYCYWKGKGIEKDIDKAIWYNECARQMKLPGAEETFIHLVGLKNLNIDQSGKFII